MNKQEFEKKLAEFREERRKVMNDLYKFIQDYLSSLPFKKDSKVITKEFGECWIKRVSFVRYGVVNLEVFLQKNNGEKSKVYRTIWGVNVEDVEVES